MIIDTDKIIKLLLEDDHSIYSIAKAIDVTRSTLNVYRQKQDEDYIKEMSLDLAMKLQNFIEEHVKMKRYIVLTDMVDDSGNPYDSEEQLKTDDFDEAKEMYDSVVKTTQKGYGASLMELNEFEEYETLEYYVFEK